MFNRDKIKRLVGELAPLRYREKLPLDPIYARRVEGGQSEGFLLRPGERWGERDTIYQLDFEITIPTKWQEQSVELHLDLSSQTSPFTINTVEGLISIDGQAFHALDRYHRAILLTPAQVTKSKLKVGIRLWSGINEDYHTVNALELRLLDEATVQLYSLLTLMLDAIENIAEGSPSFLAVGAALEQVYADLDFRKADPLSFYRSCRPALEKLQSAIAALNAQFSTPAGVESQQPRVIGIGHAHIDVAWLWRLRHTRLKAADTFSTVLYHMERYPYFTFIQSQPQLYQFVKEDQPELYARIKQKIVEGQWEPEGATWVEPDTNITGAESLVRQFLFGQRFFQQEFGYKCKVLWLPDVFGYSAALPQLIKGAGAEYFITSKISWNDTNRFPADTFWWQGLDGTRVLSYFLTAQNDDDWYAYTYNGEMRPGVLARAWKNYKQKDLNPETLVAYGWGDGGGGPTPKMIEAIPPLNQPLSRDLPTARAGHVADFMTRLDTRLANKAEVPDWVGELYFELHRGTYTSQARTKRNNRLAERDLHNAEWLASLALLLTGQDYPQSELNAVWQKVLTNHFHDILPGSSIGEVYSDAEEIYAEVRATTDKVIGQAQATLCQHLNLPAESLVVFNALSWQRDGLLELPLATAQKLGLPIQTLPDEQALVAVNNIPALGYQAFSPTSATSASQNNSLIATPQYLENSFYRLELNEKGQITRLLDKEFGREVLPSGARANVFQLFEDKPLQYDAWDIDAFYEQKSWELDTLVSLEVIEEGPLRAGLQLEWLYNNRTRLTQKLYLYAHTRRIDFVTEVDWHERQTLLKVAFPVAVHSSRATAEIQWGNLERPTHRNTSWDKARFETSAHKWFDLSEGDYGVAVLNDCKYGYDVHANVLRQTLLRGPIYPDPQADLGKHEFTYSLFPHAGGWFEGGVHKAAYELNNPLLTALTHENKAQTEKWPATFSLMQIEPANVIIETVKKAEDSPDLVVRVYECANRQSQLQIQLPFKVATVVETNLLEEALSGQNLAETDKMVSHITPYQIKTFRLTASQAYTKLRKD